MGGSHQAQHVLLMTSALLALTVFVVSMGWHWRKSQWDVVEKVVRSTFITFQSLIWGTQIVLAIMFFLGWNFGGNK